MLLNRACIFVLILITASCVSHDINKPIKCSEESVTLYLANVKDASGCSESDGEFTVTASGGEQPYQYQLGNASFQDEDVFKGLKSGAYNITVRDKNGCTFTLSNIVMLAADFKFSTNVTPDTECVNHNGSVVIDVQEGTAPFLFKMNDGAFTENNTFNNLEGGNYNFIIEDAASCTAKLNITVEKGSTDTSWDNDILAIMQTSCAVNGCHDGKTRTDFRIYANVKSKAASVKSETQNGSMPFDGPALTQSQIDLIACWVNEGAKDN
jgi:hypothetical protein